MSILGVSKQEIKYIQSSIECVLNGKRHEGQNILNKYHNIYQGKRCFILGNGPSLTPEDLYKIRNEVTFASNAIYRIFDKTNWRPTYYAIFDEAAGNNQELVDKINRFSENNDKNTFRMKFFREQGYWAYKQFNEPKCMIRTWHSRKYLDNPKFSEDLTKGLYTIATVTYANMQIARWMGFDKIYLLGMDNRYAFSQLRDGTIVRNEGVKSYFGEDISAGPIPKSAPATWEMDAAYEYAEKYSRTHGFRIFNATRGGYLEKFERVNLDDILANK